MRDYKVEFEKRVAFVKELIKSSGANGIVFGNSGGKDCTLVGIICKAACDNTLAVIMPCNSSRNLGSDRDDALKVCKQYGIEVRTVDLGKVKDALVEEVGKVTTINNSADININPRLRMTTLYAIAAGENRLVAGTGNRSERYMGYYTKWGDGAFDFDVIADLTVGEIYEFLRYLGAPSSVIDKAPSAGLFEGQTDEDEMGVSYASIDRYVLGQEVSAKDAEIIKRAHERTEHKRRMPTDYEG